MKERLKALDIPLLVPMLLLMAMGLLTLYSASRGTAQSGIWLKQAFWFALGLCLMVWMAGLPPQRVLRGALIAYGVGLLLLVAVFVVGRRIGGAQRWLGIGSFTFQPSELMKWLTLLFVSHRLGARTVDQWTAWDLVGVVGIVVFPMLLVFRQPDLGMALSFLPILLLLPLARGLRARWVVLGLVIAVGTGWLAWHHVLRPYQKQRVLTMLDPEADRQGKGYQTYQSRIAIGSGGILGQGFTGGSQTQLNFLPVKTTDFVFSVWAEERGFVGVLLALGLFGMFLTRILDIARAARQAAEFYFCVGTCVLLSLHVFVNVGMVVGLLPNKGMVLPFFSAGGSSTLSYFLALGLVMAVAHQAKVK